MVPKKPLPDALGEQGLSMNSIMMWNALALLPFSHPQHWATETVKPPAAPKQWFPPLATASPCRLTTHSLRGLARSSSLPRRHNNEKGKLRPPQSFGGQRPTAASTLPTNSPHPTPVPCFSSQNFPQTFTDIEFLVLIHHLGLSLKKNFKEIQWSYIS